MPSAHYTIFTTLFTNGLDRTAALVNHSLRSVCRQRPALGRREIQVPILDVVVIIKSERYAYIALYVKRCSVRRFSFSSSYCRGHVENDTESGAIRVDDIESHAIGVGDIESEVPLWQSLLSNSF